MSSQTLTPAKQAFIEAAISHNVLLFGDFKLKSGRQSPYFFNAGLLYTSSLLALTAKAFAQILAGEGTRIPSNFDVLFGPAYKGISLAAISAVQVYTEFGKEVGYGYNRKEVKDVRFCTSRVADYKCDRIMHLSAGKETWLTSSTAKAEPSSAPP